MMKREALLAYPLAERLAQQQSSVLNDLRPIFQGLLNQLAAMPDRASPEQFLLVFETTIEQVNKHAEDIETIEREVILSLTYEIGTIVGLPAESRFAEAWRGDW